MWRQEPEAAGCLYPPAESRDKGFSLGPLSGGLTSTSIWSRVWTLSGRADAPALEAEHTQHGSTPPQTRNASNY